MKRVKHKVIGRDRKENRVCEDDRKNRENDEAVDNLRSTTFKKENLKKSGNITIRTRSTSVKNTSKSSEAEC